MYTDVTVTNEITQQRPSHRCIPQVIHNAATLNAILHIEVWKRKHSDELNREPQQLQATQTLTALVMNLAT